MSALRELSDEARQKLDVPVVRTSNRLDVEWGGKKLWENVKLRQLAITTSASHLKRASAAFFGTPISKINRARSLKQSVSAMLNVSVLGQDLLL